jgi:formylmethanofuran dehydrogenase subunit C
MSGWMLTLKSQFEEDFDASAITDMPNAKSVYEVAKLVLRSSRPQRSVEVGDFFEITQLEEEKHFVIRGDLTRLHRLASQWHTYALHIEGNVGNALAMQMRSGNIRVIGNSGHQVAVQMKGGRVDVSGNSGDHIGGPLPGKRSGMSGGRVVIQGNAGNSVGYRLRRGTILVRGNCGDGVGMNMVAGTILVRGNTGVHLGAGMKRGTIVLEKNIDLDSARFTEPRSYRSSFASLLANDIAPESSSLSDGMKYEFRRALGDLTTRGQGEIWLLSQEL